MVQYFTTYGLMCRKFIPLEFLFFFF